LNLIIIFPIQYAIPKTPFGQLDKFTIFLIAHCSVLHLSITKFIEGDTFNHRQLRGDDTASSSKSHKAGKTGSSSKSHKAGKTGLKEISGPYKFETSKWEQRNLKGKNVLDIDAFGEAVAAVSEDLCDLGMTATLFDKDSKQVYQKTVGTRYSPRKDGGYNQIDGYGPLTEGWTGDTSFTLWSNTKVLAAATYLAAVVDTGLGYLDEPIYLTLPDYLTKDDKSGKITPRMILSHTTGLTNLNRDDLTTPYYACKYDETTTLGECLGAYYLSDDNLVHLPGQFQSYNNEPFDILAELALRKTGISNYGKIFRKYITKPLDMNDTTYDCDTVKSTSKKPHVAWGGCSTGHDFPKFVQMLSNGGRTLDGKEVLSKYAVNQIFSPGGGTATNSADWLLPGIYMTRCYARMYNVVEELGLPPIPGTDVFPQSSLTGYGLGAWFMMGNHGEMITHGGSTGGWWFVAPGRFSGYIAWMVSGSSEGAEDISVPPYAYMADLLNIFEEASSFKVSKSNVLKDNWEEIELCGGNDLNVDFYSRIGISSMREIWLPPKTCPGDEVRRITKVHPEAASIQKLMMPSSLL